MARNPEGVIGRSWAQDLHADWRQSERIPDPPTVEAPRGIAILIRGGAGTWSDDSTFRVLEQELTNAAIQVVRYSYWGPDYSCWTNRDNFKQLQSFNKHPDVLTGYLGEYLHRIKNNQATAADVPIYVIGHSAGGLIIAHDPPDDYQQLDSNKVFFLATPFFPRNRIIQVGYPSKEKPLNVEIPSFERQRLKVRFADALVLYGNPNDGLYASEVTKLGLDDPHEIPFDQIDHFDFCNDSRVVASVMSHIDLAWSATDNT